MKDHLARVNDRFGGMLGFSLVWLGQFVSIVGSSMTRFGLTIWAWEMTGKATALALVGLFSLIPMLILSPVAGMLVDRWSRKRIMILGDLIAGATTVFLLVCSSSANLRSGTSTWCRFSGALGRRSNGRPTWQPSPR